MKGPLGRGVVYVMCAIVIAVGLFIAVNSSINSQTKALREIQTAQVATIRALACTNSLALGPNGRDPEQAAECWTQEGLVAPKVPGA